MKWCYITGYVYDSGAGQATGVEYRAPCFCSDYIYDRLEPGEIKDFYITDPDNPESYYETIQEVEDAIEFYLNFSPYQVGQYMGNAAMIQHPFFVDLIKIMRYNPTQMDVNTQYLYTNPGIVAAYNQFQGVNPAGTCGFYQPPACWVGGDTCQIGIVGTITHWNEYLVIEPENFISSGKYRPGELRPAGGGYSETTRLDGYIHIDIWYEVGKGWGLELVGYLTAREYGPIWTVLENLDTENIYDYDDPSNNDPNKNNEGGNGDNDNDDGPPIIPPTLPDADMTDVGSIRIYAPTKAELKLFMEYLHSAAPVESIMKLWQNPIQGVVSLHYLPYPLKLKSNTTEEIGFMGLSTGKFAHPAEQWQSINFGYAYAPTNKNVYLDKSPYTRVNIYLPGIGIRQLNADDTMGKYVFVKYNCDNVSGQCVAFVSVGTTNDPDKATVRYTYSGSLAAPFPISQNNWGQTYMAAATLAAGAMSAALTSTGGAAASGAAMTSGAGGGEAAVAGTAEAIIAGNVETGVKIVGTALASLAKPAVSRSGTISGTTALMNIRRPYLLLEKPYVQDYDDFNKIKGYALGKTYKLGDLTGYTEVEKIHIKGMVATAPEIAEIEALLMKGVIL